jgi:hypothetical protein
MDYNSPITLHGISIKPFKEGELSMSTKISNKISSLTEATLLHHLQAVGNRDVDDILSDYSEDAILYTPDGPIYGQEELRSFFENFVNNLWPDLEGSFKMIRKDVGGEIAYITWEANPVVHYATDTFVIRDGKIETQTFAAYMKPKG